MAHFLLLTQEDDGAWAKRSLQEQKRLRTGYVDWVKKLLREEVLLSANAVGDGGYALESRNGELLESRYAETKGVVTGYFVLEVSSIRMALKIARSCPALAHGERVIVRPLG